MAPPKSLALLAIKVDFQRTRLLASRRLFAKALSSESLLGGDIKTTRFLLLPERTPGFAQVSRFARMLLLLEHFGTND